MSIIIAQQSTGGTIVSSSSAGPQGPPGPPVSPGTAGQIYFTNAAATAPVFATATQDVTSDPTTIGKLTVVGVQNKTIVGTMALGRAFQVNGNTSPAWVDGPTIAVTAAPWNADPTGAADSSAAFIAAINALAGTGIALFIPAGTYKIASTVTLKSNLTIIGTPSTTIHSTVVSGGGSTDATFLAIWNASGINTTLSANVIVGASTATFTSVAGYSVGDTVNLSEGAHVYQELFYTIVAINGGTKVVTFDRPIRLPFLSGDIVTGISNVPTNIRIIGNGMLISGTSERYMEIAGALNCYVENVRCDTSLGQATNDYWFSFDVGGRNNIFRGMKIDMLNSTVESGLVLESNENSRIIDCVVTRAAANGILLLDCVGCSVENTEAGLGGVGIQIYGEAAGAGCLDCRIVGGAYLKNTSYGVQVSNSSTLTKIERATVSYNGSVGIIADANAGRGTTIADCLVEANLTYGVSIASGVKDTLITNLTAQNNGSFGILTADELSVDGLTGRSTYVPAGAAQTAQTLLGVSAGRSHVRGVIYDDTQASTNFLFNVTAGATLELDQADLRIGSGNYGIVNYGTALLSKVKCGPVGGSSGETGIYTQTTGVSRIGFGCDFTACATPVTGTGSQVVSMTQGQGTFTSATTTGTETMTQVQAQSDVIRTAQALSGNTTTNVPANMPGLRYVAVNNSTNAHTWSVGVTGGTAVTINQGYSCIVESDGTNMVQVSPQQTASAIQADTTQSSFTVGTNKAGASLTLQSDAATTNQTLTATADAFGGSGATAPLAVDWSTSTTPFIKSGTSAATLTVGTNKTSASFTLQAGAAANALALTNPSGGALVAAQTFGQHFAHQVSKGANYTIDSSGAGDEQIWMTAACTITLPNPASATGRIIEILVGYDPAVGGGTIARNGAENINGAAANLTLVTGHKWSVLSVRCNGTDWIVGKAVAF